MDVIEVIVESEAGKVLYHQKHTGPSAWNELGKKDLLNWASVMSTGYELADARAMLAYLLFNIPVGLYKYLKQRNSRTIGQKTSWLFKRNKLDTWLIPFIWKGIFKYYGPKSKLSNLTLKEYSLTEHCYEQFANTKNIEYLDTLAAILYRPQRFWSIDTDIRRALTTYGYIKRAKRFKKLPIGLKYAIYLNYEGCRNFIIDHNPDVFSSKSQSGQQSKVNITQWSKILESAAGGKFGTIAETKESNLHEFLSELGAQIRQAREMERA